MERRKKAGRRFKKAAIIGVTLLAGLAIGLAGQAMEDLAELHVQKIVLDPPSAVTRGEDVTICARIINAGTRTADRFNVGFFYRLQREGESWTLLDTVESQHLPPSQQDFLEVVFILKTLEWEPATYEIRVVADITNQIPEIDELNNELRTTLTLLPSSLGRADLQPVELTFARTVPDDDMSPWEVTVVVTNTGDKDAGPFRTVFRIGETLFDEQFNFGLPAGTRASMDGILKPYELGLAPGTYPLSVIVDADNQAEEQDEANNTLSAGLTIQSLELHPISLEFGKSIVRLNEEVKVLSKITNVGKGVAKTVEVAFYVNRVKFGVTEVGPIGFNQTALAEGTLDLEKLGLTDAPKKYEIRVVVDPGNLLHELDEANNEMVRSLTILEPEAKRPELHPESLELNPPSPVELRKANTVTVSSVVKNTGKAVAEGFDVQFAYRVKGALRWEMLPCSDQVSCSKLALTPGTEVKFEGTFPAALLLPGIYEVRVLVDPSNVAEEPDETNNELLTTLTLLSSRLPDLTFNLALLPIEVQPSTIVNHGQTLRILAHLVNMGDIAAGAFDIQFAYLRLPEDSTDPSALQPADFVTFWTDSVSGLGVGETTEVESTLETMALDPGPYAIQAVIDPVFPTKPAGNVVETNEFNNSITQQVLIRGVDLLPLDLKLSPAVIVAPGEVIEVTATVSNLGVEPSGEFCVVLYGRRSATTTDSASNCPVSCSGDCTIMPTGIGECDLFAIGGVKFLGLGVEKVETVNCTFDTAALDAGVYEIVVDVDPSNKVKEEYEANNQLIATLVVGSPEGVTGTGGGRADLVPLSLLIAPSDRVRQGERVTISATITNRGGEPAGPFVVKLFREYLGGSSIQAGSGEFGMLTFQGLATGETATRRLSLNTAALKEGDYVIRALVDANAQVRELNEGNNQIERILTTLRDR
jgi:subtilase family serine protease